MKRLSDYKGDEALELWADLLDPLSIILTDNKIKKIIESGQPKIKIAKDILKAHKKEAVEILTRIDPEPIDGFNVVLRLVNLIAEIGQHDDIKSFFAYAEQEKMEDESGGSVMENTEDEER